MKWYALCLAMVLGMSAATRGDEQAGATAGKRVSVYENKRMSGWYLSGWRSGKMKELKGEGVDGSNCLAVTANGDKGGGTILRTKRETAELDVPGSAGTTCHVVFQMNPATNVKFRAYCLDKSVSSKEISLKKYFVGTPKDGWQTVSVPLDATATGMTKFGGIAIRLPKELPEPILLDNISLELVGE